VLTREEQAHLEGAKNLWRFNRTDLFRLAVYVLICVGMLFASWLAWKVFNGAVHPWHFNPCGSVNPHCG
jgi:predicted negative regulator of RcsB-dependent stress response